MAGELHDLLTELGARWFRKQGFGVVATEITVGGCREQPDVIAFRHCCSAIMEAKASRGDFLADLRKPERTQEGMGLGVYRFYICPEGLIKPEELPPKWGLLYVVGKKVVGVVMPQGNVWPGIGRAVPHFTPWLAFQHTPNLEAERHVLYSIARRQAKGLSTDRRRTAASA
ncbi:hypothetical protein [Ralstonia pseudosolanacearum]|uniref:hypothetical protein n=1 Tax=Ralstonia pseudosolanacearum TaxID=1310165 RepID=UPI003CF80171